MAKSIGMRAIYVSFSLKDALQLSDALHLHPQTVLVLHVLLYFTDSLPLLPILFSMAAHVIYLQNFSPNWPFISLTSPLFLLSCVMVVADHFVWFFHFAEKAQAAKRSERTSRARYGANRQRNITKTPAFMDIAAFFAICVWMVPLFLFLSLSANDNVLPSNLGGGPSSAPPTPSGGAIDLTSMSASQSKTPNGAAANLPHDSLVKSVLAPVLAVLPRIRGRRRGRVADEGIIAPRTPLRGSPLPSPRLGPSTYSPWGAPPPLPSEESSNGYFPPPSPSGLDGSGSSSGRSPATGNGTPLAGPPPRRKYTADQLLTPTADSGRMSLDLPSVGEASSRAASPNTASMRRTSGAASHSNVDNKKQD